MYLTIKKGVVMTFQTILDQTLRSDLERLQLISIKFVDKVSETIDPEYKENQDPMNLWNLLVVMNYYCPLNIDAMMDSFNDHEYHSWNSIAHDLDMASKLIVISYDDDKSFEWNHFDGSLPRFARS